LYERPYNKILSCAGVRDDGDAGGGGARRARPHRRFAPPRIHLTPDFASLAKTLVAFGCW
jgi:hypothetical protein